MIAPDHWIPVTVISESRKYSPGKKYGTSAWIGLSHAAASILLALAVIIAGSVLYSGFSLISGYIGAALLFAAAAYFFLQGYSEREQAVDMSSSSLIASVFPDPSVIPFLLIAYTYSYLQLAGIVLTFAVATVASLIVVVYLASRGLKQALSRIQPNNYDYLISAILVATGIFVILFS